MKTGPEGFAACVKEVRTQLGLSQEDLAHKLGASFASINRWENGKTRPSRLARSQFALFCQKMENEGRLRDVQV